MNPLRSQLASLTTSRHQYVVSSRKYCRNDDYLRTWSLSDASQGSRRSHCAGVVWILHASTGPHPPGLPFRHLPQAALPGSFLAIRNICLNGRQRSIQL